MNHASDPFPPNVANNFADQPTVSAEGLIPSREEFVRFAESATLIPVYKEVIADVETPVSALIKLGDSPFRYLLESVEGGDRLGRYSFVGNSASMIFRSRGKKVEIGRPADRSDQIDGGNQTFTFETIDVEDPLDALKDLLNQHIPAPVPGLPRFYGGAVGALSYDMIRHIEDLPDNNPDELDLPESYFIFSDTVLIFDHASRKLKIVVNARLNGKDPNQVYSEAARSIKEVLLRLREGPAPNALEDVQTSHTDSVLKVTSNFDRSQFEAGVAACKEYIKAGDIFQVVLSQRFSVEMKASPLDLYRVLRTVNPSPYMYYLQFEDLAVVGSSPEVMVRCEDDRAQLRPIAGTRPRGKTEEEDKALEEQLLADAKERAEHVMLVDLGRNDLGRVCEYGSVKVDEFMVVERYSHVMHIVSNVVGRLAPERDSFDLLRATFPAGTVSGAPKVRAMEIIDELEPSRRGFYTGAIGYFGYSGNMDSCITIRTVIIKDGVAHVQAGAGIVADSSPPEEYEESVNKARAMFNAISIAESNYLRGARR